MCVFRGVKYHRSGLEKNGQCSSFDEVSEERDVECSECGWWEKVSAQRRSGSHLQTWGWWGSEAHRSAGQPGKCCQIHWYNPCCPDEKHPLARKSIFHTNGHYVYIFNGMSWNSLIAHKLLHTLKSNLSKFEALCASHSFCLTSLTSSYSSIFSFSSI